jgi:hypothetical protein
MKLSYKKHYSLLATAEVKNLRRIEELEKAIKEYCESVCRKLYENKYDCCKNCVLRKSKNDNKT